MIVKFLSEFVTRLKILFKIWNRVQNTSSNLHKG